jgi:hypothetical protein
MSSSSASYGSTRAELLGYPTEVARDSEGEGDEKASSWTVYCTREMVLIYEAVIEAQAELDRIGRPHGGRSDGWGTFGTADKGPPGDG